ncbi:hypothetical protein F443_15804 [Phytophthora nicotianae P1569]|uniref:Uncharacterized protein n=1 Tax=Phytophthora nicotianae P1569 TaxID=1317065 RepID=V9EHM5_PHYNI|nr:hypothetical protein F443_15804 [Phytophthora nicotianae P1569]
MQAKLLCSETTCASIASNSAHRVAVSPTTGVTVLTTPTRPSPRTKKARLEADSRGGGGHKCNRDFDNRNALYQHNHRRHPKKPEKSSYTEELAYVYHEDGVDDEVEHGDNIEEESDDDFYVDDAVNAESDNESEGASEEEVEEEEGGEEGEAESERRASGRVRRRAHRTASNRIRNLF